MNDEIHNVLYVHLYMINSIHNMVQIYIVYRHVQCITLDIFRFKIKAISKHDVHFDARLPAIPWKMLKKQNYQIKICILGIVQVCDGHISCEIKFA